jgi:5-methylcytosine-specific restriction endonuclease McrA
MTQSVIVVDNSFTFFTKISWQRAIILLLEGKAVSLKDSKRIVRNATKTFEIIVPEVIQLIKAIRSLFKGKVPYSKRNVFLRDNYTCAYCGCKVSSELATVDHVIPKSQGGRSTWENCVTSCRDCNGTKADRTPTQAKMMIKFIKKPYQPTIAEFSSIKMKEILSLLT